jgi:hypothetical protein
MRDPQGLEMALQRGTRAGVVAGGHVGQRRLRGGAQDERRAIHLRHHDVGGDKAGEEDTGQPEQHQEEHDGHDGNEEVGHEELGADPPEQAAHEVAPHAHDRPGRIDEQAEAAADAEPAREGGPGLVRRVEGEREEEDAPGPPLQEEAPQTRAEAAIRTLGRWREEAGARHVASRRRCGARGL